MDAVHYSSARTKSGSDDWRTPAWLVERLAWFGLGKPPHLDLAAEQQTSVAPLWLGPGSPVAQDALSAPWRVDGLADTRAFLNPPYSQLRPFLVKARAETLPTAAVRPRLRVLCLIPARTDTRAWHDCVMTGAARVWFFAGRLTFDGASDPAPFPSVMVLFDSWWDEAPRFSVAPSSPERYADESW